VVLGDFVQLGFKRAVISSANQKGLEDIKGLEIVAASNIRDVLNLY